ncbi:MAG TPA: hypothetical protein VFJ23_04135 [Candidatus Nitrosotalea sp.]|nr:hypothetical protein [Candidatus Nitrosotalea sp.]
MKDTNSEGRTSLAVNHRLLLVCLFLLASIGTTYYYLDNRSEIRQILWIVIFITWYTIIGFSIIKVFGKKKIGYLVAGMVSWTTLVFWMLDNWYVVFHYTIIASKPGYIMTVRNFIGAGIAALGILSSHNAFNKINKTKLA